MEPAHVSTDAEMASLPHTEAVPVSEATNGATSFLTLPAGGNARAGGAGLRELKTQQAGYRPAGAGGARLSSAAPEAAGPRRRDGQSVTRRACLCRLG